MESNSGSGSELLNLALQASKDAKIKESLAATQQKLLVDGQPPLTFGIEFEFVVEIGIVELKDASGTPMIAKHNNLDAKNIVRQHIVDTISPGLSEKPKVVGYPKVKGAVDFESWNVTEDTTIKMRAPSDKYSSTKCYSIEVISPVLEFDKEHYGQVRKVCSDITESYKTDVNKTCAVHIHIGNSENVGFDISVVRKLMAIIWAFEPHIEQLHPVY
jgi:hypothetical protein